MRYHCILVTGGAGFIGSHLVDRLLAQEARVVVIDSFEDNYNPKSKRANIRAHLGSPHFELVDADIQNREKIREIVAEVAPEVIVHLAARGGVRPSIEDPFAYQRTNIGGTLNLLDAARDVGIKRFIFGSSSSVYGLHKSTSFAEDDPTLAATSPYAATKICGEAMCNVYAHLYGFSVLSLRFFTVYGPRQRPDLAIRKFTERILAGMPIQLYGDGHSSRDYTYISDVVQGILAAIELESSGHEIFNLGSSKSTTLLQLVGLIEGVLGAEARIEWLPCQPGDVPRTRACLMRSKARLGYWPQVSLREGLARTAAWISGQRPAE